MAIFPKLIYTFSAAKRPSCFPQRWTRTRTVPGQEHQHHLGAGWTSGPTEPKTQVGYSNKLSNMPPGDPGVH